MQDLEPTGQYQGLVLGECALLSPAPQWLLHSHGAAEPLGTSNPTIASASHVGRRVSSLRERVVSVMIVEDDIADRRLYRRTLNATDQPYSISEFAYAEEALTAVSEVQPECILLDLNLPDLDGMSFLRRLKRDHEEDLVNYPSVVMLTAFESRGLGVNALKAGASDFLSKDELDATSLEVAVRRAVREYDARNLRARIKQAEKMAAIGQLAAGVAHEINNPATFIMANLDLMKQIVESARGEDGAQLDPATCADLVDMMSDCLTGIERISDIVAQLRSQTRTKLDKVTRASLSDLVEAAYRLLRPREGVGLQIDFELKSRTLFNVDGGKMMQVISNLIVNAMHAADNDGKVLVKTFEHDGMLLLTVADSGPGVPKALRSRIFEPFYTTRNEKLGMGLGLALCADYVEKHGGTISIGDAELGGAEFTVRLPMDNVLVLAEKEDRGLARTRRVLETPRVLAIDDEPAILRAYERILGKDSELTVCSNPREALALLVSQPFDLVLCDVVMPQTDGITLFDEARLRMVGEVPRFVFCTGGAVDEEMTRRLDGRALEIFEKPVSPGRLQELLAQLPARPKP